MCLCVCVFSSPETDAADCTWNSASADALCVDTGEIMLTEGSVLGAPRRSRADSSSRTHQDYGHTKTEETRTPTTHTAHSTVSMGVCTGALRTCVWCFVVGCVCVCTYGSALALFSGCAMFKPTARIGEAGTQRRGTKTACRYAWYASTAEIVFGILRLFVHSKKGALPPCVTFRAVLCNI